jgi:type I restriction enzyme, S subunit
MMLRTNTLGGTSDFPADWNVVPLPEYVFFQEGPGLRKWQWTNSGMKVINVTNILGDGQIDTTNTSRFISMEEFREKYRHFAVEDGDIVVASSGNTYGKTGRISAKDLPLMMNTSVIRLRSANKKLLNNEFLYAFLRSGMFRNQIESFVIGSAQPNFGPSHLKLMVMPLPPLPRQLKIAGILSAYDELIENSQRRIQILEAMARALYREWFVEFRFPGHEKIPRVASSLGDVPEGWAVTALGDIAVTFRGRSYRSVDLADEGGLPFVNLKCLDRDGGFRRSGLKRYTGEYKDTQTVKRGDIVVAVTDMTQDRRIVARAALVPTLDKEFGVVSMDLVRIDPKPPIPRAFLYSFLRYSSFADEVKQHANGANVLHLAPERITDFQLAVPRADLARRFAECFAPLSEQIDALESLSDVLSRTRDLLLPRLLSGQVALTDTAS